MLSAFSVEYSSSSSVFNGSKFSGIPFNIRLIASYRLFSTNGAWSSSSSSVPIINPALLTDQRKY
jgi:hypothetical protein